MSTTMFERFDAARKFMAEAAAKIDGRERRAAESLANPHGMAYEVLYSQLMRKADEAHALALAYESDAEAVRRIIEAAKEASRG